MDWVFTRDTNFFCTSYVHALPCIAPILSFFLEFFSPAVFLYFSSLSRFSFLLMEPKKFVPSKNAIKRHGSSSSSSSSSSILDSVRFRDEKARDDFFKNFSNQAIHSKR